MINDVCLHLITESIVEGECKEYYEDPWIFGEEASGDEATEESEADEEEGEEGSGSGEGSGEKGTVCKKVAVRIKIQPCLLIQSLPKRSCRQSLAKRGANLNRLSLVPIPLLDAVLMDSTLLKVHLATVVLKFSPARTPDTVRARKPITIYLNHLG